MAALNLTMLCMEPKYLCFFGTTHVIEGAHVIAIVGIVLACIQLLQGCFKGHISAFTNGIFLLFACICLVLAKGNREAWLYLPFLIIEGIELAILWVFELLLIFIWFALVLGFWTSIIASCQGGGNDMNETIIAVAGVAALGSVIVFLIIIGTTLGLVFFSWIYLVVWRAWEFTRCELANPLPLMTTTVA